MWWWLGGPIITSKTALAVWRKVGAPIEAPVIKATGGRLKLSPNLPMVVLTSVGARSGEPREVYGTYANWLAPQLAALWGAGRKFAPGATGSHVASAAKEHIVNALLVSLAPATIAATIVLLVGVLRGPR